MDVTSPDICTDRLELCKEIFDLFSDREFDRINAICVLTSCLAMVYNEFADPLWEEEFLKMVNNLLRNKCRRVTSYLEERNG